ncbi:SEL1-like repeat protein [Candidatus Dependentiae bacterium]|nr:SEL1-like repeat protein [Candidatus Dependentiae bacterium]
MHKITEKFFKGSVGITILVLSFSFLSLAMITDSFLSNSLPAIIDQHIKSDLEKNSKEQASGIPFKKLFEKYKQQQVPFILARKVHLLADDTRFYEYYDYNELKENQLTLSSTVFLEYFLLHPLDGTWHYLANSLDATNGNHKKLTLIDFASRAKQAVDENSNLEFASYFLMLGLCCEHGSGIEKDYRLALYYYCLAAKKGLHEAHISISYLLNPKTICEHKQSLDKNLLETYITLHPLSLRSSATTQSYIEKVKELYKDLQNAKSNSNSTNPLEQYHLKAKQNKLYKIIADYHMTQALFETSIDKLLDFSLDLLTSNKGGLYLGRDSLCKVQEIVDAIDNSCIKILSLEQKNKINFINTLLHTRQAPAV